MPAIAESDLYVTLKGNTVDVIDITTQYAWGNRVLDNRTQYRFAAREESPGTYLLERTVSSWGTPERQRARWVLSEREGTLTAFPLDSAGRSAGTGNVFRYIDSKTSP